MSTGSGSRRALVTGASSGIGAAFAQRLAQEGFDLIVVARRRQRLEALAESLRHDAGVEVDVSATDLTDPDQLSELETVIAEDAALELLVNNAGFGGYRPFVELDPDVAEALIRVHVLTLTRLTRAALPGMVEKGRGAVVNVASLLAFTGSIPPQPLPHRATYAAAKAYMSPSPRRSPTNSMAPACGFRCSARVWSRPNSTRSPVSTAPRSPSRPWSPRRWSMPRSPASSSVR
jgi:short-subunit dehydrogenase